MHWPEEGDKSGDSLFLFDNDSLLDKFRNLNNRNTEDDYSLNDLVAEETPEEKITFEKEAIIEDKQDTEKLEKIKLILKRLEELKKDDL